MLLQSPFQQYVESVSVAAESADRPGSAFSPIKVIDLVILALALPVFLVAGWPVMGWVTAAAVWAMWRGIGHWAETRAAATDDPRRVAGYAAGSMIARGWIMGITIVAAGLAIGDDVGLSAALLAIVLFTVFFTVKVTLRPFEARR